MPAAAVARKSEIGLSFHTHSTALTAGLFLKKWFNSKKVGDFLR